MAAAPAGYGHAVTHNVARVVACFVVIVAVAACGGSPDPQPAPATSATARTTASAPDKTLAPRLVDQEVFDFTGFRSPSGNIGCIIKPGYVRCDIAERTWSPPPKPADCEWDYGQGISLTSGEPAQFICAGDTTQARDAAPLPYGESITAESMRCDSAESGIACRDAESGHGFSISREAYRLF
jgi:hypothetical protein